MDSVEKTEWLQVRGRVFGRRDLVWSLYKWSLRENTMVLGKFRRGWLELQGLPFNMWNETQLWFILKNWGNVKKVDWNTLRLVDLTKAKVKVEMNLNMVLLVLLEVIDGAWVSLLQFQLLEGKKMMNKLSLC